MQTWLQCAEDTAPQPGRAEAAKGKSNSWIGGQGPAQEALQVPPKDL